MGKQVIGELLRFVSELKAPYPDIPTDTAIRASLTQGGFGLPADDSPLFTTIPIAQVGAVSANGLLYDGDAVNAIVNAINKRAVDGIRGHMKDEERSTRFDLPSLMWLGAVVQDGYAYAEFYVPRYAADVREYIIKRKARRAPIATSIYGTANVDETGRVMDLEIETIDLADPTRAGVKAAVAEPEITFEMQNDNREPTEVGENDKLVSELERQRDTLQTKLDAANKTIEEMRQFASVVAELTVRLGPDVDVLAVVTEMHQALNQLRTALNINGSTVEVVTRAIEYHTDVMEMLGEYARGQVAEQVAVESARPMITEMVMSRKPASKKAVDEAVKAVLESAATVTLLKGKVAEQMGPGHQKPVGASKADKGQQPDAAAYVPPYMGGR